LDVPEGEIFLRTGLYDPASGNIGTLEVQLKQNRQADQSGGIQHSSQPQ
jgi:hypothetical protein